MLQDLFHSNSDDQVSSGCLKRQSTENGHRWRFLRSFSLALALVLSLSAIVVAIGMWQLGHDGQDTALSPLALFALQHLKWTLGMLVIGPVVLMIVIWRSVVDEKAKAEALIRARKKRDTMRVSFHQLRHVFTSLPVPYFLTHMDGRLLQGNPDALYAFGLAPGALNKENLFDLMKGQYCCQDLQNKISTHQRFDGGEICLKSKKGEMRWYLVSAARVEVNQRDLLFVTFSDMTGQKLAERAVKTNEVALRGIIEASPMPMVIFHKDTHVISMINRSAQVFFDGVAGAQVGMDASRLWETPEQYWAFINELQHKRSLTDQEMRLNGRNGEVMWVQASMTVLTDNNQAMVCCSFADITARKEKEYELLRLATTDPLTGALNRRAFHDACLREYARAQRGGYPLALVSCDLDHFKQVNDSYGHAVGDEVLRQFTSTLNYSLRPGDVFGRIGGEEFALLLPGATPDIAAMIAARVRDKMKALPITIPGASDGKKEIELSATASFGVAGWDTALSLEAVLSRADEALYCAKRDGRDCIRIVGQDDIHISPSVCA